LVAPREEHAPSQCTTFSIETYKGYLQFIIPVVKSVVASWRVRNKRTPVVVAAYYGDHRIPEQIHESVLIPAQLQKYNLDGALVTTAC
jgi:hypothetical protein